MIGVVCGLESEAEIVREVLGEAVQVRVSGASAERAGSLAQALAVEGARTLWSIGLSGGLAPDLVTGRLVIAAQVVCPDGTVIACDPALTANAEKALGADAVIVSLAGSDALISTTEAKAELARISGGDAVDMESHAVAAAARAGGVRFAAVRAIADAADRTLPAAAENAVDDVGKPRVGAVLRTLARRPGDMVGLVGLARASSKAHTALRSGMLALNTAGVFAG